MKKILKSSSTFIVMTCIRKLPPSKTPNRGKERVAALFAASLRDLELDSKSPGEAVWLLATLCFALL